MEYWYVAMQEADLDIRTAFGKLIQQRVDDFGLRLTLDGLQALTDHATPLKDADTAWRKAYPELAADFPLPD